MLRFLGPVAFAASALAAVALAGGCEALVPDTVPSFGCTGTNLDVCPETQVCAPTLGKCVDRAGACSLVAMCPDGTQCDPGTQMCVPEAQDGSVNDASMLPGVDAPLPPPVDANLPDTAPPPPVDSGKCTTTGCSCSRNGDCDSDICAGSNILTSADTLGSVCTTPCCASSDCPAGYVCFAPGTGGNYCVVATMIGRSSLGDLGGGAACSSNGNCRSGLCGSDGHCLDACCTDQSCASGAQCAQDTTAEEQQTGHDVLQCTTNTGTKSNGGSCTSNDQCHGAVCQPDPSGFGDSCMAPCCNTSACGSTYACFDYNINGASDWIPVCAQPTGNDTNGQPLMIGTGALGATCTINSDCRSVHCLAGLCTDVCCTNADCAAVPGWICQPTPTAGTNGIFLRCGAPL